MFGDGIVGSADAVIDSSIGDTCCGNGGAWGTFIFAGNSGCFGV